MTTTNMFTGLQGDKNTSRVLRPPGGGSSNIFGAAPSQAAAESKARDNQGNNIFGPLDDVRAPPKQRENTASNIFGPADSSPSKKNTTEEEEEGEKENNTDAANTEVFNPITGDTVVRGGTNDCSRGTDNQSTIDQQGAGDQQAQAPPAAAAAAPAAAACAPNGGPSSIRVRQPPGGASTKLW